MNTNNKELTNEELVYYGNYGLIEDCQLCGNTLPINRYNSFLEQFNKEWIELTHTQFLCNKCRE